MGLALVHGFELVDQPVLEIEFSEVIAVRALLVEDLADVAGLNRSGIGTHGDALVIDSLLKDPRREKNIESRVLEPMRVVLEDGLHLSLFLGH